MRFKFFLLATIAGALFAQTPIITTSPSPATAITGGTVTLTSSSPVTWGLAPGSIGTLNAIDSTHATYTAPSSGIPAVHMLAGCPGDPNDSIWHTPVNNLPLQSVTWPEAANWTRHVSSDNNFHLGDTEWPGISIADSNATTRTMRFYYGAYNYVPQAWPIPTYQNMYREGGDMRGSQNGADHHLFTTRISDCHHFETYNDALNGYSSICSDGSHTGCNATSGDDWAWNSYTPVGGTGAAGLPDYLLTLHAQEVRDGNINHGLRFTLCTGCIGGLGTGKVYRAPYWPATQADYNSGQNDPNYPPYGAIFRLKASVTAATLCGTAANLATTYCNNIVSALHNFGYIEGDAASGPSAAQVGMDCLEDSNVMAAIGKLSSIPTSDFEAIDPTSLKIASGQPLAGSYAVDVTQGGNNYVKPQGYAVVTAAPTGSVATISTHIALQPIGIGFYNSTIYAIAGESGFQIPYWTTGTTAGFQMQAGATWSITQSAGSGDSITAGGVYTPPASVSSTSTGILTATSTTDPSIKANLFIQVAPASADGHIRIDSGRTSSWTDTKGHRWLADTFIQASSGAMSGNGDYPAPWLDPQLKNNPEEPVYESGLGTTGNAGDFVYRFFVPNGNYKIRMMFGHTCNPWSCGPPHGIPNSVSPVNSSPLMLMTQGVIQEHLYNFGDDPNVMNLQQRHADLYIPAVVSNRFLDIALMGYFNDVTKFCLAGPPANACMGYNTPYLNGLEIIPDSSSPYWALDCDRQVQTLAPGSTLQFYVQDWYTGFNDAVWSVAGPGSIDQTGLYTAPASAANYVPVLIQAKSASHPQYSASRTIWLTGGSTISFK
jgi:hypothetical protein